MKKSILDPAAYEQLQTRLRTVKADSPALWGTMDAHRMLCHISDGMEQALGLRQDEDHSNFITRNVLRWLVIRVFAKMPQGAPTSKNMIAGQGGSNPIAFEEDHGRAFALLTKTVQRVPEEPFVAHPFFGPLTREERGILTWKHLDHHLRQFGV